MKGTAASMSVMKRVSLIFRAKADKALDRMEDPRETLDYSYKQQVEMLTRVRRGVADVATSRKRVELQMTSLQKEIAKRSSRAVRTWPGRRCRPGGSWSSSTTICRASTPSCRTKRRS
jgi:hypothetical protein